MVAEGEGKRRHCYPKPGRKTHHRTAKVGDGEKRLYQAGIKRR